MKRQAKRTAIKEITENTWAMMHAAYVTTRRDVGRDLPTLREVAQAFGVPFAEADRRAFLEGWELERKANAARDWHANYGAGAATEEAFVTFWLNGTYAHLVAKGPEGERLARALARRTWTGYATSVMLWEAFLVERDAREAFDAFEERTRGCATCPRRAA